MQLTQQQIEAAFGLKYGEPLNEEQLRLVISFQNIYNQSPDVLVNNGNNIQHYFEKYIEWSKEDATMNAYYQSQQLEHQVKKLKIINSVVQFIELIVVFKLGEYFHNDKFNAILILFAIFIGIQFVSDYLKNRINKLIQ